MTGEKKCRQKKLTINVNHDSAVNVIVVIIQTFVACNFENYFCVFILFRANNSLDPNLSLIHI